MTSALRQCCSKPGQIQVLNLQHYTLVRHIGKDTYGNVKLSYWNSDRLLMISKLILKEKLVPQFVIKTDEKRKIPMEVYLLTRVKHPNIVNIIDNKFFQVVIEIHDSGMDLFKFIDRTPVMTEKLGCWIFRQISNAVAFLNILHRDIKDEKVIIDHDFHIKLIDFGSPSFVQEGHFFYLLWHDRVLQSGSVGMQPLLRPGTGNKCYVDANICCSQTGLSTSPFDGEDDDEHVHMDDSFTHPAEMLDDDICHLSQDDEIGLDDDIDKTI
ncbi:PAS domain-containing serine/threonine-protein kinase-like [Ochlerotatus camptorhynchus]|uniref:PAS domain-containing serine/threonine-protein kinase-like n=1 Tax=Ochlerotatus camptorhynchus TaxID=644619 RepID=UPI0031D4096E